MTSFHDYLQVLRKSLLQIKKKMDNLSNTDESYDLGYQPSPSSLDQNDRTPACSTFSGDSFAYCRTNSETSAFSETIDDQSYSSEPSPSFWPGLKSGGVHSSNQAVLTRLGMKQHKNVADHDKLDDQEALDSGGFL